MRLDWGRATEWSYRFSSRRVTPFETSTSTRDLEGSATPEDQRESPAEAQRRGGLEEKKGRKWEGRGGAYGLPCRRRRCWPRFPLDA